MGVHGGLDVTAQRAVGRRMPESRHADNKGCVRCLLGMD